jgi:hypothetical protein
MRWYRRKWMLMAALSCGTALQVSACRDDISLFGLRWLFSSVTLPINALLRQLLLGVV